MVYPLHRLQAFRFLAALAGLQVPAALGIAPNLRAVPLPDFRDGGMQAAIRRVQVQRTRVLVDAHRPRHDARRTHRGEFVA